MDVELKILDPRVEGLAYAKPGDAAVDLRACSIVGAGPITGTTALVLYPGGRVKIGTGVAVHLTSLHDGVENLTDAFENEMAPAGLILPRSGLGSKGIRLSNTVGLVDSGYTGEIILALENAGSDEFLINPLDRLAQYLIVPVFRPQFKVVAEFSQTSERGAGAFGSTGQQ